MSSGSAAHRGIRVDSSLWPVVHMQVFADVTEADVDVAYEELESLVPRGRHVHLTDLRHVNPLTIPATLRKKFAERERRLAEVAEGVIMADARVVDHPVVRGLLTAFEWLVGDVPWPVTNHASERAALDWLRERGF